MPACQIGCCRVSSLVIWRRPATPLPIIPDPVHIAVGECERSRCRQCARRRRCVSTLLNRRFDRSISACIGTVMPVLQDPLSNPPVFKPAARGGDQATTPLNLLKNTKLPLTTGACRTGARQACLAEFGKKICILHAMLEYRYARPADIGECIEVRGMTRENAISAWRLAELGITLESWREQLRSGSMPGIVCVANGSLVGYCFADRQSGEVVVLALLAEFENQGVGRCLLEQVVDILHAQGHRRLFLGCSADPKSRSYGFYRHLGWRTTHTFADNGDEILEHHRRVGDDAA